MGEMSFAAFKRTLKDVLRDMYVLSVLLSVVMYLHMRDELTVFFY